MAAVPPGEGRPSQRLSQVRPGGTAMWLAAAAAFVLAAAGGVVFLMRSGDSPGTVPATAGATAPPAGRNPTEPSPPPPTSPPVEKGGSQLAAALDYWRDNPGNFPEAMARFQAARASKDARTIKAAEQGLGEVLAAQKKAAEAQLALLRERAEPLAEAGDYDGALAVYGEPPPATLATPLAPMLKAAREELTAKAAARLKAACDAAERLSQAGQPEKGLAELDGVKAVKCAAWDQNKLAALREKLEKEAAARAADARKGQEAEARKRAEQVLERFEASALAGNRAFAAETLTADRRELDKDALAAMAAELDAAGRVAACLSAMDAERRKALAGLAGQDVRLRLRDGQILRGRVDKVLDSGLQLLVTIQEGRFDGSAMKTARFADLAAGEMGRLAPTAAPADADGRVAAALFRLAEDDPAGAREALKEAADHALAGRLSRHLAEAERRARETGAEAFWKERLAAKIKEKGAYTDPEAGELLTALTAFQKDFGESEFAKGKTEVVAKLRPQLAFRPAAVQALFKAKVVSFDPETLEAELLWDFSDPAQLADFKPTGKPDLDKGRLVLKNGEGLRALAAFGARLKVTCETALPAGKDHMSVNISSPTESVALCRSMNNVSLWKNPSGVGNVSATAATKVTMEMLCDGGNVTAKALNKAVFSKPLTLKGSPLALSLSSYDVNATIRNLRVNGPLDRAWLEKALADKQAAPPAPAPK